MTFLLVQPTTVTETAGDARIITGSSALVLMLQQRLIALQALISLEREGIAYIDARPNTRLRTIERSPLVGERFPLSNEDSDADDDTIREDLSGNLCRCGSYMNILNAVRASKP